MTPCPTPGSLSKTRTSSLSTTRYAHNRYRSAVEEYFRRQPELVPTLATISNLFLRYLKAATSPPSCWIWWKRCWSRSLRTGKPLAAATSVSAPASFASPAIPAPDLLLLLGIVLFNICIPREVSPPAFLIHAGQRLAWTVLVSILSSSWPPPSSSPSSSFPTSRISLADIKVHPWVTMYGLHPMLKEEENCQLIEVGI